jgi:hypothetical protein
MVSSLRELHKLLTQNNDEIDSSKISQENWMLRCVYLPWTKVNFSFRENVVLFLNPEGAYQASRYLCRIRITLLGLAARRGSAP